MVIYLVQRNGCDGGVETISVHEDRAAAETSLQAGYGLFITPTVRLFAPAHHYDGGSVPSIIGPAFGSRAEAETFLANLPAPHLGHVIEEIVVAVNASPTMVGRQR